MSNFSFVDGSIAGFYLLAVVMIGVFVRKYVSRVDQFLVAGRELNVFLGIASLAACEFGIVTCMYAAQNGYEKGFAGVTPGILLALAMFFVGKTGFCIKPLRNAGVITIPELLARQFGPRIRWMSGVVIVLGGLLNMGVFLRTGGDFLVTVCGIDPRHLEITMTLLLLGVGVYTVMGGMISILITDYLQFIVLSLGLLTVTVMILLNIGWDRLVDTVRAVHGEGGFNPFVNPDMGTMYVLFNAVVALAVVLTWQTMIQRVLASKTASAGQRIYTGTSPFFVARFLFPALWGIAALTTLKPGELQGGTILAMPTFLSTFVPPVLMGIVVAAMLAADMSTDASYMLTWGGVIYNDILSPFRKKPMSQSRGLLWNRSIVGMIGVFLLLYGLWYPLKGDLWTYLTVTGSIYLSSISVLLVACSYWKRANNWGAGAAITLGALMPASYLVLEQLPATATFARETIGPYTWGLLSYAVAAAAMVVGTLIKPHRSGGAS